MCPNPLNFHTHTHTYVPVTPAHMLMVQVEFNIERYPDCGATYGDVRTALVTITDDEQYAQVIDQVGVIVGGRDDCVRLIACFCV